jgi:hypothetical protein
MEEIKLNDDVICQIKDFKHNNLTEEQKLLIDKLILNEELKNRYKENGLCKECKQPNTGYNNWCQSCNGKRFQQNFQNWTSGNHDIDELIQRTQLKAKRYKEVIEWIEYDRFENIEYLAKGGFGTTYKATWKDGYIRSWDSENNQWKRYKFNEEYKRGEGLPVALKCLHKSQDITDEFLREVRYFFYNF